MYGGLSEICCRVGSDKFPLIPQTYYSPYRQMIISPPLPGIVKISHSHRGMGKVRVNDYDQFRDLSTVVALHHDYCTAEKFIESEYGIRVQKIGDHYRVFKKISTGASWKSQFGGADLQEAELTEQYKFWADECAKCFGGMDLLAVDALKGKDGNYYIIELNGTAIGLHQQFMKDDSIKIRDLTINKLNQLYCSQKKE